MVCAASRTLTRDMSIATRPFGVDDPLQPLDASRQRCELASHPRQRVGLANSGIGYRGHEGSAALARHQDALALQLANGRVDRDLCNLVALAQVAQRRQLAADFELA